MKYAIEMNHYNPFGRPTKVTTTISDNSGAGFNSPEEAMEALVGKREMLETTFAMRYPFSRIIEYWPDTEEDDSTEAFSQHTPAPWTTSYDGHGGMTVQGSDGQQVGFVSQNQRQKANARLIAAAPEMLDALKDCLAYMAKINTGDIGDQAYQRAQSAIAKAEGRGA